MHFSEDVWLPCLLVRCMYYHCTHTFGPASPMPFGPGGPGGPAGPGGPWYSRGIKHVSSCLKGRVIVFFNKE